MVFVTLRNGKRLQYNEATIIAIESGTVTLRKGEKEWLIARIPLDIVEHTEFSEPCSIFKEKVKR